MSTPLASLTASSLVHRVGTMPEELLAAARRAPAAVPDGDCICVDFDIRRDLGRKGTRTLDRAAALAIFAVGRLPGVWDDDASERLAATGLVLATTMGSIQSTMDFTRDSFTGTRPFHVDPARFPNTVMNFAAGQCAIRYGIAGPNATVTTGHVGSFTAIRYAARLLRAGRAQRIVAGASEELSPARAAIEATAHDLVAPLAEGAAAVLVEPCHPSRAHIEVLALETGLARDDTDAQMILAALVERALRSAREHWGRTPRLRHVLPRNANPTSPEMRALKAVLAEQGSAFEVVDVTAAAGDVGSVAGMLQTQAGMAALLADRRPSDQDCAVVTATDREGALAVALLGRHGVAA